MSIFLFSNILVGISLYYFNLNKYVQWFIPNENSKRSIIFIGAPHTQQEKRNPMTLMEEIIILLLENNLKKKFNEIYLLNMDYLKTIFMEHRNHRLNDVHNNSIRFVF